MLGFMFVLHMVMIWLLTLKQQLIKVLAKVLLCESYILIYNMAISDFRDILIIHGFEAMQMLLKIYFLMIVFITLESINVLVFLIRYGISKIFRCDLDCGKWAG